MAQNRRRENPNRNQSRPAQGNTARRRSRSNASGRRRVYDQAQDARRASSQRRGSPQGYQEQTIDFANGSVRYEQPRRADNSIQFPRQGRQMSGSAGQNGAGRSRSAQDRARGRNGSSTRPANGASRGAKNGPSGRMRPTEANLRSPSRREGKKRRRLTRAAIRRRRIFRRLTAFALLLCGCSGAETSHKAPQRAAVESGERQFAQPSDGDFIAIFSTSLGEVRAVLYPDAAPMAVQNFVGLARSGYYDNTVIWRAQYGFAVQGGDAGGTGSGGATIWSNNPYPLEADSSLRHYAGALCAAFAQGGEVTGGNSQFYFVTALPNSVDETMQQQLRDNGYSDEQVSAYAAAGGLPYLDNTDTVFGQVYAGMDVVDQIACVPTVKNEDETDTYRPQEDSTVTIYKVTIDNYPGPSADDTADSAASDSSAQ